VGGLIGLAATEDWNEGKVLEASGVLDKMIPIRRKTGIRAKEALDPTLHASSRARLIPEISDDCYSSQVVEDFDPSTGKWRNSM